jgi:hypothetical protein
MARRLLSPCEKESDMPMHLVRPLVLAIAVACASIPMVAAAGPREEASPSSTSDQGIEGCGHVSEMIAARAALAAGDKDEALLHLKEARRRLIACEEQLVVEGEDDESVSI